MKQLVEWIKQSACTVVFTGAGMSTESGLPDFRSQTGLWRGQDPMRLASTWAMEHERDAFLSFYQKRVEGLVSCQPHQGHKILAKWEKQGLVHGLITQNVDEFHQRAGSREVAQLHGTLGSIRCIVCTRTFPSSRYMTPDGAACECGGMLRPNVVLFGEALPHEALQQAESWSSQAELFLVLGSSLQVSPANWFPQLAKEQGAKLVIVNKEPTPLDGLADLVIQDELIGTVLQRADEALGSR
ncbi:NAD-dependent deacetylase [Brevibacillus reuszeri]|uniref:NAD-dependent deacylase n=1 Tax=Brevibacillus reuszeri TaxID=54915 RepID=UPI001B267133|nr:NAD-dependent deacylase [Brevibacillus reuszeri]GIO05044.1 NAD-dependent deacetylase [Brevibacillus reuszeri]